MGLHDIEAAHKGRHKSGSLHTFLIGPHQSDLQEAAKLEPKNEAILTELHRIEGLSSKDKGKGKARAQPISV